MSSAAPGFVRITYTGTVRPHHQQLSVQFATDPTPGTVPLFKRKSTPGSVDAVTATTEWTNLFRLCFNPATHFGLAEVYSVAADTLERQFLYAFDIDAVGSVEAATQKALEVGILSMKTELGHPLKIYFQESIYTVNTRYDPGSIPSEVQDVADWLTGPDAWVSGYDNSYAFATKSFITKTFDPTRRQAGI